MNSHQPRDWTERRDGPPSLDGAATIVAADRRLAVRAALPSGLLAALTAWASWGTGHIPVGAVVSALLLAVSVARTVWWARGFGARVLMETPTHLVLCKRGVAEQWVAWDDLDRVSVVPSDPAPEWSQMRTDWFHVIPHPELAVMPPAAFVGGFRHCSCQPTGLAPPQTACGPWCTPGAFRVKQPELALSAA